MKATEMVCYVVVSVFLIWVIYFIIKDVNNDKILKQEYSQEFKEYQFHDAEGLQCVRDCHTQNMWFYRFMPSVFILSDAWCVCNDGINGVVLWKK